MNDYNGAREWLDEGKLFVWINDSASTIKVWTFNLAPPCIPKLNEVKKELNTVCGSVFLLHHNALNSYKKWAIFSTGSGMVAQRGYALFPLNGKYSWGQYKDFRSAAL